jgi:hypothetical protein
MQKMNFNNSKKDGGLFPPFPINPTDSFYNVFSDTPFFDKSIYENLPPLLQKACEPFEGRERDLCLIGTITVLSACMPNIYGLYHKSKVYPNLYLFVAAPASAGKGVLNYCRNIAMPIHNEFKEYNTSAATKYREELRYYKEEHKTNPDILKPIIPPKKMLFVPANNSASGAFQLLGFNDGKGLIFETEGDTLSFTFKTDYGNYSDGFRKAYHHEMISLYRKTDMELIEIPSPRLSAVLSGTPNQVLSLIPNSEDGLFSRFMFYVFDIEPIWKNVFDKSAGGDLDEYFLNLGKECLKIYKNLSGIQEKAFCFTKLQEEHHYLFFEKRQNGFYDIWGSESVAIIRRLGLIFFRIAMILSVLRKDNQKLICNDTDFEIAKSMVEVLQEHSITVYSFVKSRTERGATLKERFINKLPDEFARENYLKIASEFGIPDKSADKYVKQEIGRSIKKDAHNRYQKIKRQP